MFVWISVFGTEIGDVVIWNGTVAQSACAESTNKGVN